MKWLKILFSVIISLAVVMFSGCNKKTTTLILSEVHIEGYPTTQADYEFARLVSARTGGKINIEVHSGSELYQTESEALEALKKGEIAFARVSCSPLTKYVQSMNILQLPFLYRDESHMKAVLTGQIGNFFLTSIEKEEPKLMGLCFYDSGVRSFYTKKPINSISDMQNMRIRVMDSPMMIEMVELLGGIGITDIGTANVYTNLLNGIIDGAENNWPTYESMGDYLAAPYYNLDEHARIPDILVASTECLKSLDEKYIAIIKSCATKTQAFEFEQWAKKESSSEKFVMDSGNTVIKYTPEQKKEFEEKIQPLYEKYGKGYEDLIQEIRTLKN